MGPVLNRFNRVTLNIAIFDIRFKAWKNRRVERVAETKGESGKENRFLHTCFEGRTLRVGLKQQKLRARKQNFR